MDDLNPGFGGGRSLQRGYSNTVGKDGSGARNASDHADNAGYYGQSAGGGYKQQQVLQQLLLLISLFLQRIFAFNKGVWLERCEKRSTDD